MLLQRITDYLLRNTWQTVALVLLITFVPLVGMVGILIAAFITLRKGAVEGALVTLAATIPYLVGFAFSGQPDDVAVPLVLWAAVGVAVLSNATTWLLAVLLGQGMDWSRLLQITALAGVLVVSVVHLMYPDVANWWGVQLQQYYTQTAQVLDDVTNTAVVADQTKMQLDTIAITKQFATGVMVAGILLNAVLQLVVARWWQAAIYSPGKLRVELHNIRLSRLVGALFVLSLIASYIGNAVIMDIMPVVYLLFFAAGLSLIHYLFSMMASSTRWFWLSMMYVIVIFALPVSLVMVSGLALLDILFDVRKRFKKI